MKIVRTASKLQHFKLLTNIRMSSSSVNVKSSRKDYEEGTSIRAQKRKRALGHYQKQHKIKKPCKDLTNETTYYIENGLRKVYPYYFTFGTYVKGRWLGKTVRDVYMSEFKQTGVDPADEIENGNITVNGKKVPLDFVFRDNMMVEHKCHRHEMPVLDVPIEVIEDTEELLVINKPASIPVHPCGRYRYNSITMLLKHELGYDNLRILYRLDRLTSGLLIMPKTTSVSRKLEKQLEKRELYKEYISRVEGKFPEGEIVCNEPLGCMSIKLSLYKVDPEGKPSSTTFTRLSYNGKTSVVKCVPHTGRTHQIRVHLQFLGHPICNDPLYNSPSFGPNRGKGGIIERPEDEIAADIMETTNIGRWKIGDNPKYYEKFGSVQGQSLTSDEIGQSAESVESLNSADRLEATDNIDKKETEDSENMEVKVSFDLTSEPKTVKLGDCETVTDSEIGKVNEEKSKLNFEEQKERKIGNLEDCETVSKVCDQLQSGSLEQESDKHVKSCEVKGIEQETSEVQVDVKHSEKLDEESEQPYKRIRSEHESGQSSSVSCSDTTELKDICDTLGTEDANDSEEKSINLSLDSCTQKSSEKFEKFQQGNGNEDTLGKPVLAGKLTDAELIESKMIIDEFCQDCKYLFEDPKPEELIIYLHAVRYKGPTWEYSTPLPYWAAEDFDEEKCSGTK